MSTSSIPVPTCGLVSKFTFFFNDTATTEIYTLSLHDALPISPCTPPAVRSGAISAPRAVPEGDSAGEQSRSEEHTSELQSLAYIVCRLLLEKKKTVVRRNVTPDGKTHGYLLLWSEHGQVRTVS